MWKGTSRGALAPVPDSFDFCPFSEIRVLSNPNPRNEHEHRPPRPRNQICPSGRNDLTLCTTWKFGVLEYPEAVRVCAMRRHLRNLGTSLNLIILWAAGPILSFSPFIL